MKNFATFMAGMLIAAPLCALEQQGRRLTLSNEEYKVCQTDGCIILSKPVLEAWKESHRCRAEKT
jgi:hypothetical protein